MADVNQIATLGVSIDGTQAVRSAKEIGVAIDQMGAKADVSGNQFINLAARAKDFARAGATAEQVARMTGVSMQTAQQAVKQYAGSVSQAEIDVGGLKAAQAQLALAGVTVGQSSQQAAGFLDQLAGSTHGGALGMSYLRREMLSVAATMTGTNPILARLGFTLAALDGYGKGAITAIVGLAAAGLAIKAGMAIYEHFNAVAIANAKALTEWQKSAEGVAAQADADRRSYAALNGVIASGTIILHAQTEAEEKVREALAATDASLAKGSTFWQKLGQSARDAWTATMGGTAPSAGQRAAIDALERALEAGTISLDKYRAGLAQLATTPGLAGQIQEAERLGSDLAALHQQQSMLLADQHRALETSIENAAALKQEAALAERRATAAAAPVGGEASVRAIDDEQAALRRGAEAWAEYLKRTKDSTVAGLTFTAALRIKNAEAVREHDLALQAIRDNERTTKTLKDQADAQRELNASIARGAATAGKGVQASIAGAFSAGFAPLVQSQKDTAFATDLNAKIAAESADNDAIRQQIQALNDSKDAYDQLLISQAGTKAVTDALNEAHVRGAEVKTADLEAARKMAEAHEKLTLALQDGKKAADDAAKVEQHKQEEQDRSNKRAIGRAAGDIGPRLLNQWLPSLTNSNTAIGRFGGAVEAGASGAAEGIASGNPIGAIIGGVKGFVDSMFSSGAKAKEAARQFAVASTSFQASLAGFVSAGQSIATPGGLNAQILAVKAQAASLQQNADQIYGHHKDDAANSAAVAAINAAEAVRIQQLQQEAALLTKTTDQSLEARKLAAEGQTQAAAALNLQIQQENEYQQAVEAGDTASQLAELKQVQAMEAVKAAADGLASSFLNLNDGFRVMSDWFHAITPTPGSTTPSIDPQPYGSGSGSAASAGSTTIVVPFVADGKTLATLVVNTLKRTASAQFGDSTKWSQVQ